MTAMMYYSAALSAEPFEMASSSRPPQSSSSKSSPNVPKSGSNALLSSSVTSLSFLVALQLFSRLFTSVLNQALFRLASPSVFGTAAIQFELILSTILFLSREGVRNAILRSKGTDGSKSKSKKTEGRDELDDAHVKQLNLTFLPVLLGVPLAALTSVGYLAYASEEVRKQPHLTLAVTVYAIAALVELLSEPMHNRAMVELKTDVRVRAEGLGITAKSCATLGVLFLDARRGKDEWALVAFALGQLVYALTVWASYARVFGVPWMKRPRAKTSGYFDKALLHLSATMTGQSVIKHVLTEGDKMMLTFFSPLQDQGGYAIAANYGSLLARIVFQPLEETLRVYFSRLLSSSSSPAASSKKDRRQQAADALSALLQVQAAVSVLFIIFGSAYLPVVLPLVLPPKYLATSAPRVLGAWVYYIPVLALNGGLEAFLSSAASPSDLNRQSRWMFGFSVIYVSTAMLFYRLGLGDVSLIYANTVNLSARIIYCLAFASRFFGASSSSAASPTTSEARVPAVHFGISSLIPSIPFLAASGLVAGLVYSSARRPAVEAAIRTGGSMSCYRRMCWSMWGLGLFWE
ncbi:hypothetical protein D9611_000906 [Ephemerocybe angulata]|uniref:Man(5)GlcNAc(2)-PP-dolichol translocation protein RFT1 n=1 Tax=Ephemerocybe angulata TaxID=980116 RepID=A0A8H5BMZ1_9AGAR|nr:hypothetical protein D9611_000906 [Tulosesus angulatus]